jgi:hypothetical protein
MSQMSAERHADEMDDPQMGRESGPGIQRSIQAAPEFFGHGDPFTVPAEIERHREASPRVLPQPQWQGRSLDETAETNPCCDASKKIRRLGEGEGRLEVGGAFAEGNEQDPLPGAGAEPVGQDAGIDRR